MQGHLVNKKDQREPTGKVAAVLKCVRSRCGAVTGSQVPQRERCGTAQLARWALPFARRPGGTRRCRAPPAGPDDSTRRLYRALGGRALLSSALVFGGRRNRQASAGTAAAGPQLMAGERAEEGGGHRPRDGRALCHARGQTAGLGSAPPAAAGTAPGLRSSCGPGAAGRGGAESRRRSQLLRPPQQRALRCAGPHRGCRA